MAPVENKRKADGELDEPEAKKLAAEAPAPEEAEKEEAPAEEAPAPAEGAEADEPAEGDDDAGEDEEEDEDESSNDYEVPEDMEGPFENEDFTLRDFEGVEGMNEEKLKLFQDSFNDFVDEISQKGETDEKEPMLLEKPTNLRPVPQSVADFRERMVVAYLPKEFSDRKQEIGEHMDEACVALEDMAEHIQDASDDANGMSQEAIDKLVVDTVTKQLAVFSKELEAVEAQITAAAWPKAFLHSLILMDSIFDVDLHSMFSDSTDDAEVRKLLARFAGVWKQVLAQSDEALEIDARMRGGIVNFISASIEDLRAGEYCSEPESNKLKDVAFDFQ
jgi:hypothetical protein